jgi:hypothetical protein
MPTLTRANPSPDRLPFEDLLAMADDELLDRFSWFYIPHRDARFLRRNILVAAGNSREHTAIDRIVEHFDHPSSLVQVRLWASRSLGQPAWTLLQEYATERVRYAFRELRNRHADAANAMAARRSPVTPAVRC